MKPYKRVVILMLMLLFVASLCACTSSKSTSTTATPVASIIFSSTSMELTEGEYSHIDYVILPENANNQALSWQTTNAKIVSVDETGHIKAHASGSATITACSSNGVVATCKIQVKPLQISPYDQLDDKEKEFVDLFVMYASSYFLNPKSVTIIKIENTYTHQGWWVTLTAQNNLGGLSSVRRYLDTSGFSEYSTKHASDVADMDVKLINSAIQEKIS